MRTLPRNVYFDNEAEEMSPRKTTIGTGAWIYGPSSTANIELRSKMIILVDVGAMARIRAPSADLYQV